MHYLVTVSLAAVAGTGRHWQLLSGQLSCNKTIGCTIRSLEASTGQDLSSNYSGSDMTIKAQCQLIIDIIFSYNKIHYFLTIT